MVSDEQFQALQQKVDLIVKQVNESLQRLVDRVSALEAVSAENNEAHQSILNILENFKTRFDDSSKVNESIVKLLEQTQERILKHESYIETLLMAAGGE